MNSSGIKRGLAVSAISALAIAGIPALATSAHADSINQQVGAGPNAIVLYNSAAVVSTKNDGTDTTVRLQAGASADVTSLTFQYRLSVAGGFVDIATVNRNDDGSFSTEWNAVQLSGATGVDIRAIETGDATTASNINTVNIENAATATDTVNLAADSAQGVFNAPYGGVTRQNVIVSGTTSEIGANQTVDLSRVDGDGTVSNTTTAPITVAPNATTGTFAGILDINGYTFGAVNELIVQADRETQDFEGYTLYNQTIKSVTAVADATNVPAGSTAKVVVTVLDQNDQPIAGAEVRSSDGAVVGLTDVRGVLETTQGPGTRFYYANATDNDPFVAGEGDQRSADIAVTAFTAIATSLTATSRDGNAFDFNEYNNATKDDITVQVKNQNGGNFTPGAGQTIQYYWQITPFAGGAVIRVPATLTDTATDVSATDVAAADGRYEIQFPVGQPDGTYELFAALSDNTATPQNDGIASTSVLVVKAGESAITFSGNEPQSAPAGTSSVVTGKLALADGTALPGRAVRLTYSRAAATGTDGSPDAGFADGNDTGTEPDTQVDVVTGADGSFTATVVDPPEAAPATQGTEAGGVVTATTQNGTVDQDNPAETATRTVNFVSTQAPAGSVVLVQGLPNTKPGVASEGTVKVTAPNQAGVQTNLANQQVVLTLPATSGAFFTDNTLAAAPVIGADAGRLRNLGKSITVTTDGNGVTEAFYVTIERDTGFDDDGLVTAIVTATAGTAQNSPSDTEDIVFDSNGINDEGPLNGGEVRLVLAPADEQEGPTDPAGLNQDVEYDVYTTDQFGNLVGGELVTISSDNDDVDIDATDASANLGGTQVRSDFDDNGEFSVSASGEEEATITASWTTETSRFTTATGGGAPAAGNETLTDSENIAFEADTFASATLTGNPELTAPVNTAVTETFTAKDQDGNGIPNVSVTFTRTGPGGAVDTQTRTTNANGVATYTFTSAVAGTATITAEATTLGQTRTATDTVEFTAIDDAPFGDAVITSNPEGSVKAGATVVETVTVTDTNGDGISGATVEFTRSDTGATVTRTTNSAGQASFAVTRATAGTVAITAVVDYGTGTEALTDSITFTGKTKINVNTTVGNANGGKTDIIRINVTGTNAPNGATATLFKRVDGRNVRLASKTIGNRSAEFRVRDLNKRQLTLYFVRVSGTSDTFGKTGPVKKVR